MWSTLAAFAALLLADRARALPAVQIRSSINFSPYASIEARAAGIQWEPRLTFLPRDARDFATAFAAGAWTARLDGPGGAREQTLMVDWRAPPEQQAFRLDFTFGSNATHWYLYRVTVRSAGTTAVALRNTAASGIAETLHHGHAIAARKGRPFECHYLELPLILTAAGSGGTPAAARAKAELQVGMVAGLLVLEDFVLAGWEAQARMRHVNRVEVEPCGTQHCGIQSTRRLAALDELWLSNIEFDGQTDPEMPRWRYFGQARPYLWPLERVCGSEREIDAMRRNGAAGRRSGALAAVLFALACVRAV